MSDKASYREGERERERDKEREKERERDKERERRRERGEDRYTGNEKELCGKLEATEESFPINQILFSPL